MDLILTDFSSLDLNDLIAKIVGDMRMIADLTKSMGIFLEVSD